MLGYSQQTMDKLTLLVFLLFIASSALAFFLWQRIGKVEDSLKGLQASKEDKQSELETTRKDAKRRREETESLREDLQNTKAKLKKLQKKEQDHKSADQKQKASNSNASKVGAVVRVSNVEARHQKQIEALREQMTELEKEIQEHKVREAKAKAATEKAAKSLKIHADQDDDELDPDVLKTQIEALKRAAIERESELKRSLKRAKADARTHERRASTNHQLYQVAKGQLSLLEDRLARLKLKHEGATDPSKLIKEKSPDEDAQPVQPQAEESASTEDQAQDAQPAQAQAEQSASTEDQAQDAQPAQAQAEESASETSSEASSETAEEAAPPAEVQTSAEI